MVTVVPSAPYPQKTTPFWVVEENDGGLVTVIRPVWLSDTDAGNEAGAAKHTAGTKSNITESINELMILFILIHLRKSIFLTTYNITH